jgi:cation diffusion facilitator CzcD-associated flavoprotein CzcO
MIGTCDVAVVGAGPHGLATAAHLLNAGVRTRVFGREMSFWRDHMPGAMLLRSSIRSSSIASPKRALSLSRFAAEQRRRLADPLPLSDFLDYSSWFRESAVPDVDPRFVVSIDPHDGRFRLTLADGERLWARRVVVAAGIAPFAFHSPEFSRIPPRLASHSLDHTDFSGFSGQRVLVVGGGQSALESAALLHENGANVEVVVRAPRVRWLDRAPRGLRGLRRLIHDLQYPPTEVGPRGLNWIVAVPDLYRATPRSLRAPIARRCIAPAGADWLEARLAHVTLTAGRRVIKSTAVNGHLQVDLDDSTVRRVDHALLATGYRVDVARYTFLTPELVHALDLIGGSPVLSKGLEASVPGLHFVGAPAALSFGPVMRFVCGSWYAAPAVTARILGLRRTPRRLSW